MSKLSFEVGLPAQPFGGKLCWLVALLTAGMVLLPGVALGQLNCFNDLATWCTALGNSDCGLVTDLEILVTDQPGVALADEVGSPPGLSVSLGNTLTFSQGVTGFSRSFVMRTLESGAQFVWDDVSDGPDPDFLNALSVGRINDHENDDFEVEFISGVGLRAVGFFLQDSNDVAGESLEVFSTAGSSIGSCTTIGAGNAFVGVITDQGLSRIRFDEDSGGDDIAVRDLFMALSTGDLSITKDDGLSTATPGDSLTYTIQVSNNSALAATGATVSDTFSAPLSGCTWTCSPSGSATCTASGSGNINETVGLPGNTSVTFSVTCATDAAFSGIVSNTATVTPPTDFDDTDSTNNSATDTTDLIPQVDLALTKDDGVNEVDAGDDITYSLTVTNNGPNDSTGGSVVDTLPGGFTFVSSASGCADGGSTVTCSFGTLANGESTTLTFVANVDAAVNGTVTNSATVSGNEGDSNSGNDMATHAVDVIAQADLALSKQDSPDPVVAGQQLTYTLTVTNNGPSASTGGTVTDTLDSALSFASSSDCSDSGGTVTCSFGALPSGDSQVLQFTVDVDADEPAGTVSNGASVSGNEEDPVSGNNTAGTTTEVIRQADLETVKIDNSGGTVVAGETIDYTITVANLGPNNVLSAVVSDTFPTQLDDVRWTCIASPGSSCDAFGSGNINDAVNLLAGGMVTYSVTADVKSDALGNLINLASASNPAGTEDPDPSNNASSVTTEVIREADLRIAKEDASGGQAVPGGTLSYRLVITNDGPSSSSGGTVTDTLPSGVTFRGSTSGCTGAGSTVSCDFGALAQGSQRTLVFTVDVEPGATGTLTNVAEVSGLDPDPDGANNLASHDTSATPQTDLKLDKDGPVTASAGDTITYTLEVTNLGPSSSSGSTLSDTLPEGVTFLSSGSCSPTDASGTVVTCNVGSIAPNASTSVSFDAEIASSATSALFNSAEVTANEDDPAQGNNTSDHLTTVDAQADLSLVKSGDNAVVAGENLTYSLTLTNLGPADTAGGSILDTLPAGVQFLSSTDSCTGVTGAVTCTFGALPAGENLTLSFIAAVDGDAVGPLENQATVQSNTTDPISSNNGATFSTTVTVSSDLGIALDDGAGSAVPGEILVYSQTVTNLGPSATSGGEGRHTLPTGTSFEDSDDGCAPSSGDVICPFGNLSVGESVTLRFLVRVDAAQTTSLSLQATVTGNEPDPAPGNDTASLTTPLKRQADLALAKDDGVLEAVAGETLTYTLTVINLGPSDASGQAEDPLPPGLSFVMSPDGCSVAQGVVTCPFTDLAAGSSLDLQFEVQLDADAPGDDVAGTVVNTATVSTSDAQDPNPANDGASHSTPVVRQADLSLTKDDGVAGAAPGTDLTYTLTVTNAGPSETSSAEVFDLLPEGVQFIGSDDGCTAAGSEVRCPVSSVAPAESFQLSFSTRLDASLSGIVTNNAEVVGADSDPDPSNNTTSHATPLDAEADLSIEKTDDLAATAPGTDHTYRLTVRNLGPSDDPAAIVTDNLPSELTGATWTCQASPSSSCAPSGIGDISDVTQLASGGVLIYTVRSTVAGSVGGTLENTATVTESVTDPDDSNNAATDTTSLDAIADLEVSKDNGVSALSPGSQVTYAITVDNRGPSDVVAATLEDTFPPELTNISWTCIGSSGGSCNANGSNALNESINLPDGGRVVFTVQATVATDAAGLLVNTVEVSLPAGVTDPDPGNNRATDIDTLDPAADLAIQKSNGLDTVAPGQVITYDLTVRNLGPGDAAGAQVTDLLPNTLQSVTWTCTPSLAAVCAPNGSGDVIDTVAIPSGGQLLYQVTGTVDPSVPPAQGGLVNTATVAAPVGLDDPAPTNNSASDIDTLQGEVDLVLTKTDGVANAVPGGTLTYVVTVQNLGPSDALGARVVDTVPAGLSCVWTCAPGATASCLSGQLPGDLLDHPNLPAGDSATYSGVCQLDEGLQGDLLNQAMVSAPAGSIDVAPANNVDDDVTSLLPTADLRVTLSDGVTEAVPGQDAVHYSMVVHNDGPSHVQGARLSDSFPDGLQCVWQCTPGSGSSCPSGQQSGDLDTLVDLEAGSTLLIAATCQVAGDASGTLRNTLTIAAPSGVTDPQPSNNSASDLDTVLTPTVQVTVQLDDGLTELAPGLPLTYTLTVTNAGPSDAVDVSLGQTMPPQLEDVTWSCDAAAGASCSAVGAGDLLDTVQLPSGSQLTYTIDATVRSDAAAGDLVVEAQTTLPLGVMDLQPSDNLDDDVTVLVPQVDLAITKDDGSEEAVPGTALQYTLSVTNAGPSDAIDSQVSDLLPAQLLDASWTCAGSPGASCTPSGLGDVADTVRLPPGGQLVYTLNASVAADAAEQGPRLINTATVLAADGTQDLDGSNNSATDENSLTLLADLVLSKTDGLDTVAPGGEVTYVLELRNDGPADVPETTIQDEFPSGLTCTWRCEAFLGAQCGSTEEIAGNLLDTPSLVVDGLVRYSASCQVSAQASGTLLNTAQVSLPEPYVDPVPEDNQASDATDLVAVADLVMSKNDGRSTASPGDLLTYTLVVSNPFGPSDVDGATVEDDFPQGMDCLWSCSGSFGATCTPGQVAGDIFDVVTLPVGSQAVYTALCQLGEEVSGTLVNGASITVPASGVVDSNPSNNTAQDTTDIVAQSTDLEIVLSDGVVEAVPGTSLTYTLVARQLRGPPGEATVQSLFPPELDCLWTCQPLSGASCAAGQRSGDLVDVVQLQTGASLRYSAVCEIDAAAQGGLSQSASIEPVDGSDANPSNNFASDVDTVLTPKADLSVSLTDGLETVLPGGELTYTVTVRNVAGPSTVEDVTVEGFFPETLDCSWTCTLQNDPDGHAACTSGPVQGDLLDSLTLPSGSQAVYSAQCDVSSEAQGTLRQDVRLRIPSGAQDPTLANNQAQDTTSVQILTDLQVELDDGTATAVPGATTGYTLTVRNVDALLPLGPKGLLSLPSMPVQGLLVRNPLPDALECVWTCDASPDATCDPGPTGGDLLDSVDIPAGGQVAYTAACDIDAAARGILDNAVDLVLPAGVVDLNPESNSAQDSTLLTPQADLALQKSDGAVAAVPGEQVIYHLTASNPSGPSDVFAARLVDDFPASLDCLWSCQGSQGGQCPSTPQTGDVDVPMDLPVGGSAVVQAVCQISPTASGFLSNTAHLMPPTDTEELQPLDNTASDLDTQLSPTADLSLSKSDGVETAVPGGFLTYSILATNAGPSGVQGVQLTDDLPDALSCTWTCSALGGASCDPTPPPGDLQTSLDLPVDSRVLFTGNCQVDPAARGTVVNSATLQLPSGVLDPSPEDLHATDGDTELHPRADFQLSLDNGVTEVVPGEAVTYTLRVDNVGPSSIFGAVLETTSPPSVSCLWTCQPDAGASCDPGPLNGPLNTAVDLLPTAGITYTGQCQVLSSALGTLSLGALVTVPADTEDPVLQNNQGQDVDVLTPVADVSLSKDDGETEAAPGETLTYTLEAQNAGPSDAHVTVSDVFPTELDCNWTCLASADATCTAGPSEGDLLDSAQLPAGSGVTYTAACAVDRGAQSSIVNTATAQVQAPAVDPQNANNEATDVTDLAVRADISIHKDNGQDHVTPGDALTYEIVVNNGGPSDVDQALVRDLFPADLDCVWSCDTPTSGCPDTATEGDIDLQIALDADQQVTFTAQCQVDTNANQEISNTATVLGPEGADPDMSNNTSTDTDLLLGEADLAVLLLDEPDPVTQGDILAYGAQVTNQGPSREPRVRLEVRLPDSVVFLGIDQDDPGALFLDGFESGGVDRWDSAAPASVQAAEAVETTSSTSLGGEISCTSEGIDVTCDLASLASQDSREVVLLVGVPDDATGTLITTVTVRGDFVDPDSSDNSASALTTVEEGEPAP